jgi:para-nitrobenzyl esterase
MAHMMSESWLAFARTGDPNHAAIPQWTPYDLERRTVMLFDRPAKAAPDPHREERLAMERYPTQQLGRTLHRQTV